MAARPFRITLANGDTITVQPTLEDRLRFETTLRKNKGWGSLKDNALKLEPFLAWSAAHRTGQTALSWEEFTTGDTAALDVEGIDPDDAGDDDVEEVDGLGERGQTEASTGSPSSSASASKSRRGSGAGKTDPS
jgi:hypothetical protein